METPCANCGSTVIPKYRESRRRESAWCCECVVSTLDEQHDLRFAPERHEVFDPAGT